jgi:hypothetical protein
MAMKLQIDSLENLDSLENQTKEESNESIPALNFRNFYRIFCSVKKIEIWKYPSSTVYMDRGVFDVRAIFTNVCMDGHFLVLPL